MDGRIATFRVVSEVHALDRANDVLASAQEGRRELERAHQAHWQDDPQGFLTHIGRADLCLREIRDTARQWAGDLAEAPEVSPDQLPLLLAA